MTGPLVNVNGYVRVRTFHPVSWKRIVLADPCPYCAVTPRVDFGKHRMTLEHVQPIARGGTNVWSNLVAAHQGCNQQRSDRSLLLFLLFRHLCGQIRGLKGPQMRRARRAYRRQFFGVYPPPLT